MNILRFDGDLKEEVSSISWGGYSCVTLILLRLHLTNIERRTESWAEKRREGRVKDEKKGEKVLEVSIRI